MQLLDEAHLDAHVLAINGQMDKHKKFAFIRLFTGDIVMQGLNCRAVVGTSCVNSSPGMASYMQPPKKGASSYVSRYAAVRDTIGLPHIDLIGSTSRIHLPNGRAER